MVVIIAVAAALTVPNITAGARQREVRRTMQRFVSAVRRSSSVAVFGKRPVELRIDPEERAYRVVVPRLPGEIAREAEEFARPRDLIGRRSEEDGEEGEDVRLRVMLPELAKFGELEGGGTFAEETILVEFYPNGSSSGASIEFIFDTGRNREQTYTLLINPLTSAISFAEEDS